MTSNQSVSLSPSTHLTCFDSLLPSPVEEVYVQQLINRCKAWCASAVELIFNHTLCTDTGLVSNHRDDGFRPAFSLVRGGNQPRVFALRFGPQWRFSLCWLWSTFMISFQMSWPVTALLIVLSAHRLNILIHLWEQKGKSKCNTSAPGWSLSFGLQFKKTQRKVISVHSESFVLLRRPG